MQHRRRDMHDLVRLLCVALGCLARREIREPGLIEVELHQLGHCQLPVAEMEAAFECVCLILGSMTREVNKVGVLDLVCDPFDRGMVCDGVDTALMLTRLCRVFDRCELTFHEPQPWHRGQCAGVFAHSEDVEAAGSSLRCLVLCVEQRRECRSVGRDRVVRAADSIAHGTVVDACCVDRQESEVACGTPMQPRLCAACRWLGCNCQTSNGNGSTRMRTCSCR
jgi:hypothetical protein